MGVARIRSEERDQLLLLSLAFLRGKKIALPLERKEVERARVEGRRKKVGRLKASEDKKCKKMKVSPPKASSCISLWFR